MQWLQETITAPVGSSDSTIILLGLFTLIGTLFSGTVAFMSNRHAKSARKEATEVNNAVNHRIHGEPSMIQMVVEMHNGMSDISKWRERVDNDLERVDHALDYTSRRMDLLNDRVDDLRGRVFGHHPDEHGWDGTERRRRQHPFDGVERRRRPFRYYDGPERRRSKE